ncbi:hypothetical protein H920_20551 [Fukomys damarensis]|uniref:Uncharacterized protein n=1 Tax=Fukomys damarensis TaxID=885580 RepID=A0A091CI71_FUKDA|nr:hypothetical protein H920_20551 [Fukomys damarensis]
MAHGKQTSGSGSRSPEKCAKKSEQAQECTADLWQQPLSWVQGKGQRSQSSKERSASGTAFFLQESSSAPLNCAGNLYRTCSTQQLTSSGVTSVPEPPGGMAGFPSPRIAGKRKAKPSDHVDRVL